MTQQPTEAERAAAIVEMDARSAAARELIAQYPNGKVAELTLRVRWFPGAEDQPSQWRLWELLQLEGPDYVSVVSARDVPGMDPEQDPEEEPS